MGGRREEGLDREDQFRRFVENELHVLENTYRKLDVERVFDAVSMIRQARTVYVAGTELVTGLCSYLTRRLLTVGIMAVDLSNMSRAIYNNYASHIGPEDVVIIFSAPGYAKYIVNTARYLAKKYVPQIVVTDRPTAPAAAYGTTVLFCDNHDLFFYNSILGYLSVANLLVYFTALEDPEGNQPAAGTAFGGQGGDRDGRGAAGGADGPGTEGERGLTDGCFGRMILRLDDVSAGGVFPADAGVCLEHRMGFGKACPRRGDSCRLMGCNFIIQNEV